MSVVGGNGGERTGLGGGGGGEEMGTREEGCDGGRGRWDLS